MTSSASLSRLSPILVKIAPRCSLVMLKTMLYAQWSAMSSFGSGVPHGIAFTSSGVVVGDMVVLARFGCGCCGSPEDVDDSVLPVLSWL